MKRGFLQIIIVSTLILGFMACEKEDLTTDERDSLVGSWNVIEKEAEGVVAKISNRSINDAYVVSISKSEVYESDVLIRNFFQLGDNFVVEASINDKSIEISQATIDGTSVRGSGTISNNKKTITWSYWVDMGDGEEVEYKATYKK